MATNRRSVRKNRSSQMANQLGLEGLEPRMVLSGIPIDLQPLVETVLTRLSSVRLPAWDASDPVADVEPSGFSVSLPSAVPNGLPVRALIVAVGTDNRPVPFSGDVTLSSSDPAAVFPETVTLTRGRGYVSVKFATEGEQSLTVSGGGETAITGSDTTRVAAPIVATQLAILLPESTRVGAPVKVMIMALDASGRSVPNFSGDVTLTSTDEAASLPETITFDRGRAVATVTFGTAGEQTIVVKAGDLSAEAATTVVAQPAVTDFRIEIRPELIVGEATRVVVVAVDDAGEPIRDFSGSATLASSDARATLPETVQFRRGRAVFEVAFAALGDQQLTVTSDEIKATAATTVKSAPSVVSIGIWMPGRVVAGLPMIVQVMALNADGRLVRGFNGSLNVTSSDADATLPGTAEFIDGIALLQVTFATAGEQTLTVSNSSTPDLTATSSTTVMRLRLPSLPPWLRR
jgi:hypothetical protein